MGQPLAGVFVFHLKPGRKMSGQAAQLCGQRRFEPVYLLTLAIEKQIQPLLLNLDLAQAQRSNRAHESAGWHCLPWA